MSCEEELELRIDAMPELAPLAFKLNRLLEPTDPMLMLGPRAFDHMKKITEAILRIEAIRYVYDPYVHTAVPGFPASVPMIFIGVRAMSFIYLSRHVAARMLTKVPEQHEGGQELIKSIHILSNEIRQKQWGTFERCDYSIHIAIVRPANNPDANILAATLQDNWCPTKGGSIAGVADKLDQQINFDDWVDMEVNYNEAASLCAGYYRERNN